METPISPDFGIDVPVFAFSHCRDVVAAVSRAGGFGVFGGGVQPEQLELELKWLDAHTDRQALRYRLPDAVWCLEQIRRPGRSHTRGSASPHGSASGFHECRSATRLRTP